MIRSQFSFHVVITALNIYFMNFIIIFYNFISVILSFCFQAMTICIEDILELHRGQGMDIFWRDNFTCPSEADYKIMTIRSNIICIVMCNIICNIMCTFIPRGIHMYVYKGNINIFAETGGLFNLAVRLMKLFSTYEADFSSLIATLGLYFQIRDDYCNLCLSEVSDIWKLLFLMNAK